jgi:uncharacterized protein
MGARMIFSLFRILLLAGLIYILYKWLWKGESLGFSRSKKKKPSTGSSAPQPVIEEMKRDPVCGTFVPVNQAIKEKINNTVYFFCSEECKQKFHEIKK